MSDAAETKPDPTTQAPEEQKPAPTTTGEGEKSTTEAAADTAKEAAETVKDGAAKTSDTVFSMFGGGPKKEKKEEPEEPTDEPSGSSKAQKAEEVSFIHPGYSRSGYRPACALPRPAYIETRGCSWAPRACCAVAGSPPPRSTGPFTGSFFAIC